jgi:hypothetical protein
VTTASDFFHVGTVDVARLFGESEAGEAIVFEIYSPDLPGRTLLYWMYDAEAYAFIRKLTDVLFDADPPRSGVGSPGALHGS